MSTRKKRHLIAGTIIGGLLLAATTQTGNSFALSDTSSTGTNTSSPTSTSQTTTPSTAGSSTTTGTTPDPTNTTSTPTSGGNDATAAGSVATQSANTSASSASAQASPTTTTPSTASDQTTAPQSSTSTNTDPLVPSSNSTPTNTTTDTNKVDSTAKTGDASVKHTATGGDATTGNASAVTSLINSLASSANLNSGNLQTFNYNVNGTQNGDVVINPNAILSAQNTESTPTLPANCLPASASSATNNATINNLINLLAQSGDAKVSDNGEGGNATSGDATTEANVVNMIQDLVSNKGAFLGVVNINGNLNGNIELPSSVANSLLTPTGGTGTSGADATNNFNVNNNINLTAISGNAAVTNNGVGGNATSGNAQTILQSCTILNSDIVGGNVLLVFVNVMGQWYGALLGEPAGDTTATLGGGITQDTLIPTTTNATNNSTINNNLNLTSMSGNATVANNGAGGNATTGKATAIADVTNILGSQINLSGWLGILIINVYGTWNGGLAIQPNASPSATFGDFMQTPTNPHQSFITTSAHRNNPSDGFSYYIVNPPQSFDGGQFELASANVSPSSTLSSSAFSASVRPAAATSTHASQTGKHEVSNFILAGIGSALAISGGVTRFFTSRRKGL